MAIQSSPKYSFKIKKVAELFSKEDLTVLHSPVLQDNIVCVPGIGPVCVDSRFPVVAGCIHENVRHRYVFGVRYE